MTFSEQIIEVRKELMLSQEALAAQLGVAFATVNRWEKGHVQPTWKFKRKFYDFCDRNSIVFKEKLW